MAEVQDSCTNQTSVVPPCSPQLSHHCHRTPTWLPAKSALLPSWSGRCYDDDVDDHRADRQSKEPPSCRLYEELFCTSRSSVPLVPLAGALMATSRPQADVVKGGYLGTLEQNNRRYFVLRTGSHTGPSRLEWFKSQEKFTATEKSVGKSPLLGSNKQGVIYLRCCLGVSRIGSSRKGHTVALYDKAQTMVLVMEDQQQQEDWYEAIKKLMEEEQKEEEQKGVEEDDGYCTLPPAAFFKEKKIRGILLHLPMSSPPINDQGPVERQSCLYFMRMLCYGDTPERGQSYPLIPDHPVSAQKCKCQPRSKMGDLTSCPHESPQGYQKLAARDKNLDVYLW
ncbi:uncharacterized protein LOC106511883 [Austrofundulus limnaeus]|uniref:Uncharacterized protein LOC106511883 n=1 Tax=Austrofundulus limnaeus TaxID=52670 RepID=A0A2I4AKQ5_AUSLI|nr:PREDICTED: uncharacterized protein LOC106511883 [Austrofundulus limnaeus]